MAKKRCQNRTRGLHGRFFLGGCVLLYIDNSVCPVHPHLDEGGVVWICFGQSALYSPNY